MYQSADLFIFSTYSQGHLIGPFCCETCDAPPEHLYVSFSIDYFPQFSPVLSQIHVIYSLMLLECYIIALFSQNQSLLAFIIF